jgi:sugar phosphate isomerase/epimerase
MTPKAINFVLVIFFLAACLCACSSAATPIADLIPVTVQLRWTHQAQFAAVAFKGNFATNLARIAALGYQGVELAIRDPRLVDVEALAQALAAHGLGVPAIGTGQAWGEERLSFTSPETAVRRQAVERIMSHLPLAARFGALVIIGLIRGVTPTGQSQAQSMQWLIECLQECAAAAAQQGVRLALEPVNRYETDLVHSADEGLALLERVGADNMGLLLDTFHMNIEEASIEDSIRRCGSRLYHFHVADSNRWYPGAGHLNFRAILRTLAEIGYAGWVSGEFLPLPDPATAAQEAIRHLSGLTRRSSRQLVSSGR